MTEVSQDTLVTVHDACWGLIGQERFQFRHWKDSEDAVCYDTLSGDTLLLNPLATQILQALQHISPLRLDAISSHVAASLDVEIDADLAQAIADTLSEFSQRGIVAPV